jgi:hypothetical protein
MNKSWANFDQVKVALRNQQVLTLLLQECSNKRILGLVSISPHTAKQQSSAIIPSNLCRSSGQTTQVSVMFGQRSHPKVAHLMPQSSGVVVK